MNAISLSKVSVAAALLCALSSLSLAATNVATSGTIIDGSGAWNQDPFNVGNYNAMHVIDGSVTENGNPSDYWLGRDGNADEYFTLDLGQVRNIKNIGLRNTNNGQSNDRGTGAFRIFASETIDGGNNLVDPTIILGGTLPDVGFTPGVANPSKNYNEDNGLIPTRARYLKFVTITGVKNNDQVGLNEIEVFQAKDTADPDTSSLNRALGKPVVDGSGAWNNRAFIQSPSADNSNDDIDGFGLFRVTDGRINDQDLGEGGLSMWLGRENTSNEFFVVDLGQTFAIDQIDLQNTHNRQFDDRGTADFNIQASGDGNSFFDVMDGTLNSVAATFNAIPTESFSSSLGDFNTFYARFVRFEAESFYGSGSGLNEIRVFGTPLTVPEPMTGALALMGLGALGMSLRRRRRDAILKPRGSTNATTLWVVLAMSATLCVATNVSLAASNVALNKPIIDGSGAWNNNDFANRFNDGFQPERAVDGKIGDNFQDSYWLGREGQGSAEYFVVDLESALNVKAIGLRNSHNAQFNDRGTRDFQIFGSNNAADITGPTPSAPVILSGKITSSLGAAGDNLIPLDQFNSATGLATGSYRYIRFQALTATYQGGNDYAFDGSPGNNNVGLNEIEVYTENVGSNVAGGKPVVDGSGAWNQNPFNVGQFAGENITDLRLDDFRDDNSVDRTSYWLGREQTPNEYLTIDLQDTFNINEIDLQNSHNAGSNDRGTASFSIEGSLDGNTFFPVFGDTLVDVRGVNPGFDIPIETFSEELGDFSSFRARFVRFNAETFYGSSSALNEIFVIGSQPSVPEPMTGALALLGLGALALRTRRRRRPA